MTRAISVLLEACVRRGVLRDDLDPSDVLLLMGFMWRVTDDDIGRAQARRMMDMAIDGFRV